MTRRNPAAVLVGQLERVELVEGRDYVRELPFAPDPALRYRHTAAPKRRTPYRFDFAFEAARLVVEVEGGVFKRGGRGAHTSSVRGYLKDVRKYALATLAGWRVLRVTRREIDSGEALDWIEVALGRELKPITRTARALHDAARARDRRRGRVVRT